MNAASSLFLDRSSSSSTVRACEPVLTVPEELLALFEESPKAEASFANLHDEDRRGFVRYINEARVPTTRERRAAIIAMSLLGLANEQPTDARS